MKTNFARCALGLFVLAAVTTVRAQTIWNYVISDVGNGNSLVTWDVTGSMTIIPGPTVGSSLAVSVVAPGIFAGNYSSDGTLQGLATPDGSYFALDGGTVYEPIVQYATDTVADGGNDSFGLAAPLPLKPVGTYYVYTPGTQSVVIPVPFSDFNPGTYQSVDSGISSPLTVNLTVVPEPSMPTLALLAVLCLALAGGKRKRSRDFRPRA